MNSLLQNMRDLPPVLLAGIFFVLISILNWLGHRTRKRVSGLHHQKEATTGHAEGSLLGLMALLLAFSFGMASTQFENRRQLIIDESNLISSAILRSDLYPDSIKQWILPDFRQYVESRIDYYNAGSVENKIKTTLDNTNEYFNSIWNKTVMIRKNQENRLLAEQMVPFLINMKNIVATREAARLVAIPFMIILVLLSLVFVSSFVIGYGDKTGQRNPVLSFAFALMTSSVLFLIMELSRPRQGFINFETAQQSIVDLRKMFQ